MEGTIDIRGSRTVEQLQSDATRAREALLETAFAIMRKRLGFTTPGSLDFFARDIDLDDPATELVEALDEIASMQGE